MGERTPSRIPFYSSLLFTSFHFRRCVPSGVMVQQSWLDGRMVSTVEGGKSYKTWCHISCLSTVSLIDWHKPFEHLNKKTATLAAFKSDIEWALSKVHDSVTSSDDEDDGTQQAPVSSSDDEDGGTQQAPVTSSDDEGDGTQQAQVTSSDDEDDGTQQAPETSSDDEDDGTQQAPVTSDDEGDGTQQAQATSSDDDDDGTQQAPVTSSDDEDDRKQQAPVTSSDDEDNGTQQAPVTSSDEEDDRKQQAPVTSSDDEDDGTQQARVTSSDDEDVTTQQVSATSSDEEDQIDKGTVTTSDNKDKVTPRDRNDPEDQVDERQVAMSDNKDQETPHVHTHKVTRPDKSPVTTSDNKDQATPRDRKDTVILSDDEDQVDKRQVTTSDNKDQETPHLNTRKVTRPDKSPVTTSDGKKQEQDPVELSNDEDQVDERQMTTADNKDQETPWVLTRKVTPLVSTGKVTPLVSTGQVTPLDKGPVTTSDNKNQATPRDRKDTVTLSDDEYQNNHNKQHHGTVMVNFKADHAHFSSALCIINTFRNDSSFCDVKLIIGKQSLQAHKCVLAAGSPYFRALFLGQFTEANMDEINLSKVTSSSTALERIVNFIYTGEIDIDEDNIEDIIKLASFFLIESLEELCCTFMTDNLSLTTCLRYYLYCVDHGVSVIEQKTRPIVQSRFHDHLIYEDETLSISTSEMKFLLEINILQHCSDVSILRFIAMWVNKGLTERHVVIAKEIFDYVIERDHSPQVCSLMMTNELSVDSLYEMTESSLNDIALEGRDLFLNSFKEVLGKITTENEVHAAEMNSQARHNGKETVVIAMCPSNDAMERQRETHACSTTNKLFLHVFAYVPRTRCWYSLKKFYYDGHCSALFEDETEYVPWRFDALHDELYYIDDSCSQITVNNINNLENSGISIDMNSLYQICIYPDFCLAAGKHGSVYLVAIFKRFESNVSNRVTGLFLNGYKFNENGKILQKVFQTDITAHPSYDYDESITTMHAKISTVSNEMIVHVGEFNILLVADLNQNNTNQVTVLSSALDDHYCMEIGKHTQIIETKDAMYIIKDGITDITSKNGKVTVKYEYRLNSKQLSEITSKAVNVGQLQENIHSSDLYPFQSERSASVGDGLWYMEGSDNASFLTKVTLDDNKTPVIEHHRPPPFHCVTAMFGSRISSQILENKEIITRYLGNE